MDGSYPIRGGRPYRRGSGDGRGRGHEQGRGDRGGRGSERGRGARGGRSSEGGRGDRGGRGHERSVSDRGGRGNERGHGQRGGRGRGGGPENKVFSYNPPVEPHLDRKIIEEEDQAVISLRSSQGLSAIPPPRPSYGAQGRKFTLWANYFRLEAEKGLDLHRYSVQVSGPDPKRVLPKRMIKRIIEQFIAEQALETDVVTDFGGTILMQREFEFNPDGYIVTFREREEDEPSENALRHAVRVQYTGRVDSASLLDHSTSSNLSSLSGAKQETIQALNILLGYFNKSQPRYAVLGKGRTYDAQADDQHRMSLGGGLEVIRGFIFSVRAATARALVNVQIKSLAFYQSGPLVDVVNGFLAETGPSTGALERFLKKLKVDVMHIVRSNRAGIRIPRIKTITGLAHKQDGRSLDQPPRVARSGAGAKAVEFFLKDQSARTVKTTKPGKGKGKASSAGSSKEASDVTGRYITVAKFFQQQYNINILAPDLPVVNVGSAKDPSYLPLQVCHVIPGQPGRAMPTPSQTQQMIRFSVRTPGENAKHITTTGLQQLGLASSNTHTQAFGVSIEPTMITVPGRILQAPQVRYGKNPVVRPSFASWNLQSTQLARPAVLRTWTYLVISPENRQMTWPSRDAFHTVVDRLAAKLRELGITCPSYTTGQMIRVRREDPEGRIAEAVRQFTASPDRRPHFVLVVLPSFDGTAIYNRVKQTCDVEYGLLHVCVVDNKFARANEQYLANVCLKINLKLGSRNHILDPAKLGVIAEGKTMVVGVDVTHPSPGSAATAPSVAAVVASIDSTLAQWPAILETQSARQEMVSALKDMFKSRLRLWQGKNNNSLPQNIIVYRDGVSEGQYQVVLDNELPALRQACVDIYPANNSKANQPRISIIIVGKRHHTRFYATSVDDADRSGNPPNGTVVDRGVTESRNWDFFLQAHSAIQGTARPAHYFVLLDEIFRGSDIQRPFLSAADILEDLTHNMCYLFGRATKAVSICPPAYYADLACERARCYLAQDFDPPAPELSDTASTVSGKTDDVRSVQVHESVKDVMFYI